MYFIRSNHSMKWCHFKVYFPDSCHRINILKYPTCELTQGTEGNCCGCPISLPTCAIRGVVILSWGRDGHSPHFTSNVCYFLAFFLKFSLFLFLFSCPPRKALALPLNAVSEFCLLYTFFGTVASKRESALSKNFCFAMKHWFLRLPFTVIFAGLLLML